MQVCTFFLLVITKYKLVLLTIQYNLIFTSDESKSSATSNSGKQLSEALFKNRGQNLLTEVRSKPPTSEEIDDQYTPGLRRRRQLQDKYVTDPSQLNLRFQRPQMRRSRESYYRSR